MSTNPKIHGVLRLQNTRSLEQEENIAQIFTKHYDTGELLLKGKVANEKLNGRGTVFYKNGNIHCDLIYKDNQLHGLCKGYYLHGALSLEILFDMGIAVHGFYYKKKWF